MQIQWSPVSSGTWQQLDAVVSHRQRLWALLRGRHHSVLPCTYSEFSVSWLKAKGKTRSLNKACTTYILPQIHLLLSLAVMCLSQAPRLGKCHQFNSPSTRWAWMGIDAHEYDWNGSPARLRLAEGCEALLRVRGNSLLLPLRHSLCLLCGCLLLPLFPRGILQRLCKWLTVFIPKNSAETGLCRDSGRRETRS